MAEPLDVDDVESPPPPMTTPPGWTLEVEAPTRLGAVDLDELEFPLGMRLNVRPESLLEPDDELELLELPPDELLDPDEPPSPDEPDEDEEPDDPEDPDDVLPPRGIACAPAISGTASATAMPRTNVRCVDLPMVALPGAGCWTPPTANSATLLPLGMPRNCLIPDRMPL